MTLKIHVAADSEKREALCKQANPCLAFPNEEPTCKRCLRIQAQKGKP
jgi:hypothetical protein